jgi:transcriptional regulator with XRE-family HTH domain
MDKTFGTLVRQLRSQKGYSLRELAWCVDLSPNFLSKMELGHFPPPSERKIVLIAETLEQNKDDMLALAGKVSSDLIEIILQRPKETTALLRRLRHAPARKIAAANDRLAAAEPLDFYPLETVSRENHTAVVGESGSGKSLLTKYLIKSYFQVAHVLVYDGDAAPWE